MPTTKLFISHADSDRGLVQPFVDLIEGGIGVSPGDIFCSSLKGQGIKPGADFNSSIRGHLDEATCVVAVLTANYYASAFCMCELGGVWLRAKSFIPVLVPPLSYADLKAVLVGMQSLRMEVAPDLDELRDEVSKRVGIQPLPTPRWNLKRDAFLKALPKLLKAVPAPNAVSRATHDKVLAELAEYKKSLEASQAELSRVEGINADLMKLKDGAKAAAVIRKHSTAVEQFESLVKEVNASTRPLPACVCEALYYHARGEEYHPKENEDWDEVERAREDGFLALNSEENGVYLVEDDAKVNRAIAAVSALAKFLSRPPSEFSDWYRSTFEGVKPNLTLRPFWREHLGL